MDVGQEDRCERSDLKLISRGPDSSREVDLLESCPHLSSNKLRDDLQETEVNYSQNRNSIDGAIRQFAYDVGSSSRRQSLRTAVFDLTPFEEFGKGHDKKGRRVSPFSHNPLYRRSYIPKKTASALALEAEAKSERGKAFFEPLQLIKAFGPDEVPQIKLKARDQFSLWMKQQRMEGDSRLQNKRSQASVHTVTVPKKGLIKLTGLAYEFDNPGYYDDRKERPAPRKSWDHTKFSYILGSADPSQERHLEPCDDQTHTDRLRSP